MAAKASDPQRIELALRTIDAALGELPSFADDWQQLSEDERLDWSLSWGNEMAKLRQLTEAEAAGHVDPRHFDAIRALAERAVQSLDLVKQLGLRAPDEKVLMAGRVRS
jgi:hypothetical protein